MRKQHYGLFLLLLIGLSLNLSSCRKGDGDELIHKDQNEFSPEDRVMIGEELDAIIESETGTFNLLNENNYSTIYEYFQTIFNSLVNTSAVENRDNFNWKLKVIVADDISNSFITPGGTFYITTGLLKSINSEHELISVIGHEIYYADSDVLLSKLRKQYSGVILGDILLGNSPAEARDMAMWLKDISYMEEEVLEADQFAIDIICDFLYDPRGMKDFLDREAIRESIWAINRPSTDDRLMLIDTNVGGCGPGSTFEERYQQFLEMLP